MNEFAKTIVNGLKSYVENNIKKARSNWNQNDETAIDYVKNRTHWTEEKYVDIIPETIVSNPVVTTEDYNVFALTSEHIKEVPEFTTNTEYTVIWNGTEYKSVAKIVAEVDGIVCLGNDKKIFGTGDTGEPFFIMPDTLNQLGATGEDVLCQVAACDGSTSFTFKVSGLTTIIHKLDEKYLPDFSKYASVEDILYTQSLIPTNVVKYTAQPLTDAQKSQVRDNIGVEEYPITNIEMTEPKTLKWPHTIAGAISSSDVCSTSISGFAAFTHIYGTIKLCKVSDVVLTEKEILSASAQNKFYSGSYTSEYTFSSVLYSSDNNAITVSGLSLVSASKAGSYSFSNIDGSTNGDGDGTVVLPEAGTYLLTWTKPSVACVYTVVYDSIVGTAVNIPVKEISMFDSNNDKYTLSAKTNGEIQIVDSDSNVKILATKSDLNSYVDLTNSQTIDGEKTFTGVVNVQPPTDDNNAVNKMYVDTKISKSKDYFALTDIDNGHTYIIQMKNGSLVTRHSVSSIDITTMPNRTEFYAGEIFDPTGMVVTATCEDGSVIEITNYTCSDNRFIIGENTVTISYIEAGNIYTTTITVNAIEFNAATILVDFDYTDNGDGTYTITAWKGTKNGVASTEMVVPNSSNIIF